MPGDLRSMLERWIAPLKRRVAQMVLEGIVNTVDDTGAMQLLNVEVGSGEPLEPVQRIQAHGLTSNPEEGSEALVLLVGGNRDRPVAVVVGTGASRPTGLAAGEVAVYRNPDNMVVFKANGDIELHADGKYKVTPSGDIELGATAAVKTLVNDTFATLFDLHTHNFPAPPAPGAPTGPPLTPMVPTNFTTKTKAE